MTMRKKIILDTDMGNDCDDAGALALLHNLVNQDEAEIMAVVHCGSEISGTVSIKSINTWYNRGDIPVGRGDNSVCIEGDVSRRYTVTLMNEYLRNHEMPKFENSVKVIRRALAENNGITIVVIGMLNNIAELLKSEPDEISPLNGMELVKKSVSDMYVMGGHFKDLTYTEWNIKMDPVSAKYVADNFPMPIIYCGYELGEKVITGKKLKRLENDNPVKMAYEKHSGKNGSMRFSWDPITVYCAVERENSYFKKSEFMKITFDDEGRVVLLEGGKDCYMVATAIDDEIFELIDELIY